MRKIVPGVASAVFVITLGVGLRPTIAQAAKVDCAKVTSELNSGKKAATVAQDLKISTSSVYRCKHKVPKAAATAAAASPMAAPTSSKKAASTH